MKRFEPYLPSVILWSIPVLVFLGLGIWITYRLLYNPPPPSLPPSPLSGIPVVEIPQFSSKGEKETALSQEDYDLLKKNPFLKEKEGDVKESTQISEPPLQETPKERIHLSSIFIVDGKKLCIINGSPYEEGIILGKGHRIENIDLAGITINLNNGGKIFIEVGKEMGI